jgi:predicted DNA-binding transcriptional regulator AlpA
VPLASEAFRSGSEKAQEAASALAAPLEFLLTLRDVQAMTRLSRSHIYRLMDRADASKFPDSVHLAGSRRLVRWRLAEVQAWMVRQSATRRAAPSMNV